MNDTDPRFRQAAIRILPDDALLDIFSFYVDQADKEAEWHTLVHVCQRWRNVVFGSPRRLHLTLVYDPSRPVGEMLDIWPAMPFVIILSLHDSPGGEREVTLIDNTITALEHHERIRRIAGSYLPILNMGKLVAGMCQPFPMLTSMQLSGHISSSWADMGRVTCLPDSFLGGSAPRLRTLTLIDISFPALPNLLLSANGLVHLDLWDIPKSAYIPPDEMVVCLSTLTRLKTLYLGFCYGLSGALSRRPPLLTHTVLHALTTLWFSGDSEYWEDFISRIDAPLLNDTDISFPNSFAPDTPQFVQFINRTEMPRSFNRATIGFYRDCDDVALSSENLRVDQQSVRLRVSWNLRDLRPMTLSWCYRSSLPLPLLSVLEYLDMHDHAYQWEQVPNADHTQWLDLLRLFPSVRGLSLSDGFTLPVMTALGELVGGRVLDVLPVLQNVHLHWHGPQGPLYKPVGQFVAARELSGHPVAIHGWGSGAWIENSAWGRRDTKSARCFLTH